jgi:hypothetical protein
VHPGRIELWCRLAEVVPDLLDAISPVRYHPVEDLLYDLRLGNDLLLGGIASPR